MQYTKAYLKDMALSRTLFQQTTLKEAVQKLGFIQADPIRSPARAQDLIMRLRVKDYLVHDLEANYHLLGMEEDFLYAYGFMTKDLHRYVYPRKKRPLSILEKKIISMAHDSDGQLDSRELEKEFGRKRVINNWGGYSQAIKVALENLHHAGHLRIAGRHKGKRLYALSEVLPATGTVEERLTELVLAVVNILAPVSERTLTESLMYIRRHIGETKSVIEKLVKQGIMERHQIDGIVYLWPTGAGDTIVPYTQETVRFLAPFDPLVWDRRRFEHLWGWPYRFEAYTPQPKRIRGYYAMPLLWGSDIIGWANLHVTKGKLQVETGFVEKSVADPQYLRELEAESVRMEHFLTVPNT